MGSDVLVCWWGLFFSWKWNKRHAMWTWKYLNMAKKYQPETETPHTTENIWSILTADVSEVRPFRWINMFMARHSVGFLSDAHDLKTTYSQFKELKGPECLRNQQGLYFKNLNSKFYSGFFSSVILFFILLILAGKRLKWSKYTTVQN